MSPYRVKFALSFSMMFNALMVVSLGPRSLEHWSVSREEHVEHNSRNRSPWTGKPSLTVWQCFIPLPAGWKVYCRCLCVVRSSVLRIIAVDPDPSRLETCLTLANFWFLFEDMNGISDIMVLHCFKALRGFRPWNLPTCLHYQMTTKSWSNSS